jgi:uncharacterized protein
VNRAVVARWRDWSGEGLEHLVLREGPDGIRAEAMVLGVADDGIFAARYRVHCDAGWRTRRLEVSLAGDAREVDLSGDGAGRWTDRSGAPLPDLAGAIDVDLTATPFTNTLPIRRLDLRSGETEVIVVVYVEVPALTVTTSRQRYTCLEPGRRYRFESLESGFTREIEVDDGGLVRTYPDLFRRVP